MPKITVSVSEADHMALKLLSIVESKNIGNVLVEAVRAHLKAKGAHDLNVQKNQNTDPNNNLG